MKKGIKFLIALTLSFILVGCSTKKPEFSDDNVDTGEKDQNVTENEEQSEEDWGVVGSYAGIKDYKAGDMYFRWPVVHGTRRNTGYIAYQNDGSTVLVDGYVHGTSPEVGLDQLFPAYFEQTLGVFRGHYGSNYSDGKLTLESSEPVTIDGYDMYKFTGRHKFVYKSNNYDYYFVAYATALKYNGAYVYWLVQDETTEQTARDVVEKNAYKVAASIWEEN